MKRSCAVFLIGIIIPVISCAENNRESKLPEIVINEIKALEKGCLFKEEKQQSIKTNLSIVKELDINKDGLTDYVINDIEVHCEAGASYRHGNGGTGVTIITKLANNKTVISFKKTVHKIFFDKDKNLKILVGGKYCNQQSLIHKSEIIYCEKKLIWNPSVSKFELSDK